MYILIKRKNKKLSFSQGKNNVLKLNNEWFKRCLQALQESGCFRGNARPLSMAANLMIGSFTTTQSVSWTDKNINITNTYLTTDLFGRKHLAFTMHNEQKQ